MAVTEPSAPPEPLVDGELPDTAAPEPEPDPRREPVDPRPRHRLTIDVTAGAVAKIVIVLPRPHNLLQGVLRCECHVVDPIAVFVEENVAVFFARSGHGIAVEFLHFHGLMPSVIFARLGEL